MPRIARNGRRVRMNLDMPEEVRQQIEELRDRTQAESMSEVIRRALAVYDYLCDEKDKGNEMIVRSSEGAETRIRLL